MFLEYVPAAYMRRHFLSGFGGSAGTAVVTQNEALLWTDSRYWSEANMQIDSSLWTLMKQGQPKVPTITKWLAELATKQYVDSKTTFKVGIDPYVHPASFAKEVTDAFSEAAKKDLNFEDKNLKIGELDTSNANLIDLIWGDARPEIPYSAFRVHPLEYAGVSYQDKVTKIRKEMETKKATLSVFCTLDDVAYLLNMRAMGDVDTCPIGIAYATVTNEKITLYCDPRKLESAKVQSHLKDVTLKPYDDIVSDVETHCTASSTNKVWMDASRANYALKSVIPNMALVDSQNAVAPMKAVKNQQELEGMRQAHIVDGVAMAKFMAEMCERIQGKSESIIEVEVDLILTGYRAEQPGFLERSFPTIAGVGGNAAIIHYRAEEGELMKYLDTSAPILIDSGGQYTYGTTDVTRTWHFGTPTEEFKDTYTRVLKGHIGLDSMIFPENIPGFVLDVFARKHLWESGKDYGHGTGHGVGAALNVHEGPFGISPRFANLEGLKKGFVVSNEPGYYEDGNFGIRIENLLEIAFVKPEHNDQDEDEAAKSTEKRFLKFHKLTMIPMQKNLIKMDLITDTELDWLDAYHEEVFANVSPRLEADSPAMKWLETSCAKVDRK
jgi:Xaa-Pro aminopeptidase